MFYNFIIDISNFDIIPTEWLKSKIFKFSFTENDEQFELMGYKSPNIVENLGSMLIYVTVIIFVIIVIVIIRIFKHRYKW